MLAATLCPGPCFLRYVQFNNCQFGVKSLWNGALDTSSVQCGVYCPNSIEVSSLYVFECGAGARTVCDATVGTHLG